ncbi:hypothetical protein [Acinetobacter sp.]|uniref:hypothetical protein n=1 Tax=Acinetobacter sp. TaxID=472 RepID=UPI003D04DD7A
MNFISDNLLYIGLILISPSFIILIKYILKWIRLAVFKGKEDISIIHYRGGKVIKEVIIKANPNEPLVIIDKNKEIK